MKYIKKFEDVSIKDIGTVGGKNASLGEMITQLSSQGILIPTGFAVTAQAYWDVVSYNKLLDKLKTIMAQLTDKHDMKMLSLVGSQARALLENAKLPPELEQDIKEGYKQLSDHYSMLNLDVAVRSSATAEDSPQASFAGQQDSFLDVRGEQELLDSYKKCIASLFTDRAIIYRIDRGFDHFKMAISVGVQKMVRSDLASSGVAFSLDTETGFKDVVVITSSYGLGESIVQGLVIPDEFTVFKTMLAQGFPAIIRKKVGTKETKRVYGTKSDVEQVPVPESERRLFSLNDEEILLLARWVVIIEKHYSDVSKHWFPVDVEWAKDGKDGKLYVIQARPETIHAHEMNGDNLVTYKLKKDPKQPKLKPKVLVTGESIGQKISHGVVRVIESVDQMSELKIGEILVTHMTDPDWVPIMKRACGIITTSGGRTCHAAIVSRELGIPAIVGAVEAMKVLKTGQEVTIDCSLGKIGYVYEGKIPFDIENIQIKKLSKPAVPVMVNLGIPERAFTVSFMPVAGVGLARVEFIISNTIGVHPMAVVEPEKIKDKAIITKIKELTAAYKDPKTFYISSLTQGISTIAAAFYPRPVYVRLPDFKTNEYRNLIAGEYFEQPEDNPMMGLRGASRYYHEGFNKAFALDCEAIKKAREEIGLKNIKVMVPFVRTVEEGKKVLAEMAANGLVRGKNGLEIIMMCEVPANVLMIDELSKLFDGFSIGSNDLTQFTLSVDRDSTTVADLFDESSPAEKKMLALAIEGAHRNKKSIGICGQAPSDDPKVAEFLICRGIDSISLNSDAIISFLMSNITCKEDRLGKDITIF